LQQAPQLEPQQPWQPPAPPQLPLGHWVPHEDATEAEGVIEVSWVHEPPQLAPHTDCEHAASLGQLQFPAQCPASPKAIPIPANSRTIDTIANFFIQIPPHIFSRTGSRTSKLS